MADLQPAGEQALRLLMGPMRAVDARGRPRADRLIFGTRMRWVTELNGHPGRCGPECWHRTPEAALRCFLGTSDDAM